MARSGGARIGATAPWGLVGTGAPAQDPNLDAELAAYVKRQRDLLTVNALRPAQEGGGQPVVQPQPQSVGDVLQVGKYAVDISKSVAEVSQAEARAAREELAEAKANAGSAYEAGKQEALTVWQMMDERDARHEERMERMDEKLRLAEEERRKLDDARRDSEAAKAIAELKAQMDKIQEQHEREREDLKKRAEAAEGKAAEAAKPKSPAQMAIDLLAQGKSIDSPEVQALLGRAQTTGEESFERTWQREMGTLEIAKVKREHTKQELLDMNAVDHDAELKAKQRKIFDRFDSLLELGQKWLEGNVRSDGQQATKAGLPHNGFGGTMDDMARQAQQIAAQQAAQQPTEGGAE